MCIRDRVKWWGLGYEHCSWERVGAHPALPALLRQHRRWTKESFEDASNPSVSGGDAARRAVARLEAARANRGRVGSPTDSDERAGEAAMGGSRKRGNAEEPGGGNNSGSGGANASGGGNNSAGSDGPPDGSGRCLLYTSDAADE